MEENKEILNPEENEVSVDTDISEETNKEVEAEATGAEAETEETVDEQAESEDLTEVVGEAEEKKVSKKKPLIQFTVIVSAVILAVVAITFLVMKCFFDTSVVGTWLPDVSSSDGATVDEATLSYVTFNSDGTMVENIGTIEVKSGDYTTSKNEDGTNALNLTDSISFQYEVSGNIFTGRKLVITLPEYEYSQTYKSASVKPVELEVSKDFKADSKLTGEWSYESSSAETGDIKIVLQFFDNGRFEMNKYDSEFTKGVYIVENGKISMTYNDGAEQVMELEYTPNDNGTAMIGGIEFKKK